jgi:hypothetical protein
LTSAQAARRARRVASRALRSSTTAQCKPPGWAPTCSHPWAPAPG